MNKNIILILIVFNLLFTSCITTKYEEQEKTITYLLKSDNFLKVKKCIILIPALGCGSCTKQIIDFSKIEINNDSLLFIYSDLTDKTEFIYKDIKVNNTNFFKDSLSILISRGFVENKPVAYFIDNEHIVEIIKFDDSNVADIITRINKKY